MSPKPKSPKKLLKPLNPNTVSLDLWSVSSTFRECEFVDLECETTFERMTLRVHPQREGREIWEEGVQGGMEGGTSCILRLCVVRSKTFWMPKTIHQARCTSHKVDCEVGF